PPRACRASPSTSATGAGGGIAAQPVPSRHGPRAAVVVGGLLANQLVVPGRATQVPPDHVVGSALQDDCRPRAADEDVLDALVAFAPDIAEESAFRRRDDPVRRERVARRALAVV